ncbi:MAG TPA: CBS domain-containing protein [Candidatus Deferrimicrobium sp.]|nr:CBS domain-containing protein [Candidatus Deferrimicrobium sp.]
MKNVRIELEKFINVKGKILHFGEKKPLCAESTNTVLDILNLMIKNDMRVVILTDKNHFQIKGIVVCGDICGLLGGTDNCKLDIIKSDCYHQIYDTPISEIMTTAVRKVHENVPLFIGIQIMIDQGIGTLPLIDRDGDLLGVITERDIAFLLADTNIEVKVRDIMTPNVISCTINTTIKQALKLVCGHGFRRLPVVDNKKLVGYFTVKDLLRYFIQDNVIQHFKDDELDKVSNEPVTAIMSTPVITISPDASVNEFAQILKKYNIGALPVVEAERLVGIITERDIMKAMAISH